ncbi:MAG: 3-methyl-2-oxobutanoate dehydrogenase subunit VorB [Faecalibacterium sp.]|nr:3-methyl-2-oxobutanoate dehydrogenase subunit VorB [Ruminococcus sp.]MCM1391169.1 3-methyl-2-oxobutanoate dehydrogenase subunit VorB [Ruminococcus sp.]MCM1486117.1 3-methyl-2-oxobutanoate dehydrogenase subunit VorB [Faecalibacterium sp.]
MEKRFMKGCEAIAEAAVRGGCRFFAGYPITPQNEIPEYLSWRLPEVGGSFVQGESEVASINMVYGAASMGTRSMTSSSGPGISLKAEGISYLASARLPAVIVNISRGGPGLGSIQPAQSDYLQATKALGHGGFHTMVFAPWSAQEAVDLVYDAWEFAEKDRNPVLILMDGCLGNIMEEVTLPPMKDPNKKNTDAWSLSRENGRKENAIITPIYTEPVLEQINAMSGMLYKSWEKNDVKVDTFMLEDAEYVVVAYGIAARVAKEAVIELREQGHKIGMIRPITLYPFPKKCIHDLDYNQVKGIIDIEMTIPAQMREDIELQVMERCPVYEYGRSGGILLDDDGVRQAIEKIVTGGAK